MYQMLLQSEYRRMTPTQRDHQVGRYDRGTSGREFGGVAGAALIRFYGLPTNSNGASE
jgi:hypothetical protein